MNDLRSRTVGILALVCLLVAGCSEAPPVAQPEVIRQQLHAEPIAPDSGPSPATPSTPVDSGAPLPGGRGKTPAAGGHTAQLYDEPVTDEAKLSFVDEVSKLEWQEKDPLSRQRPSILIVICEDYLHLADLEFPAEASMQLAAVLAHCSYDVKVLIGMPQGANFRTHPTTAKVCEAIYVVNTELEKRNKLKKHADVAPLKRIDAPKPFHTTAGLKSEIHKWLTQTFGNANRPPFGAISFNGHGIEDDVLKPGAKNAKVKESFFMTPESPETPDPLITLELKNRRGVSLMEVSRTAAGQYSAPLWMIADMCRDPGSGVPSAKPPKPRPAEVYTQTRKFENASQFSSEEQEFATSLEKLRARSPVGVGRFQRDLNSATILHVAQINSAAVDKLKRNLTYNMGQLLKRTSPEEGFARLAAADDAAPRSVSLGAIGHSALTNAQSVVGNLDKPDAYWTNGVIGRHMVVVSSIRGYPYQRVTVKADANLFAQPTTVSDATGFTVATDGGTQTAGGPVVISRGADDTDFKAIFKLSTPALVKRGDKIVVNVAADPQPVSTPVVVGLYENTKRKQLSTHFGSPGTRLQFNGQSQSIVADVSLAEGPAEVAEIELQVQPAYLKVNPNCWPVGASLRIMSAFHVPAGKTLKDIMAEDVSDHKTVPSAGESLFGQWWHDTLLHPAAGRISVSSQPSTAGGKSPAGEGITIAFPAGQQLAGVTGPLYPKRYVHKDVNKLHVELTATLAKPDAQASVWVYDESGRRVLAKWVGPVTGKVQAFDIPCCAWGLAGEINISAIGLSQLKVTKLRLDKNDS